MRYVLRILVLLWQWVPLNEMACLIYPVSHACPSLEFVCRSAGRCGCRDVWQMLSVVALLTLSAPWFCQTSLYFKIYGRRATVHG